MIEKHFAKENKNAFRRRRSMKRITIVLLSVLLVASLFVSCKVEVDDPMADLVSIRFTDDDGSKGLNVTSEEFNKESYTWYYAAKKNINDKSGLKTGETNSQELGKGLSGNTTQPLSQGLWDFTLWAVNEEGKIYQGTKEKVKVDNSTVSVKITVTPLQSDNTNGYLVISDKITLYDANGNQISSDSYTANIEIKDSNDAVVTVEPEGSRYTLQSGLYKVTITYVDVDDNSIVYGTNTTMVSIYDYLTTTIGGSIDESTGNVGFDAENGVIVVDATVIDTDSKKVSIDKSLVDGGSTTVDFGEYAVSENSKLSAVLYSYQGANKFIVVKSDDSGYTLLGGLDLTVNDKDGNEIKNFGTAVTVSTYVGKGYELADLKVVYNGTGDQPKSISYDPETGILTFETTHFSQYYVVNTGDIVAVNETQGIAYKSLQAAVDAATNDDVIVLQGNTAVDGVVSGDGVFIGADRKLSLTIDFNGLTYNVNGKLVGSKGTENQAFHLEKDNKITLKNGKIQSSKKSTNMLIQNYSDLVLQDIVLDATKSSIITRYALSCNHGTILITGKTSIINSKSFFAIDVCYWFSDHYKDGVSVIFDEGFSGHVSGKICVSNESGFDENLEYTHVLSLENGDFSKATFVISGVGRKSLLNIKSTGIEASSISISSAGFGVVEDDGYYKLIPASEFVLTDGGCLAPSDDLTIDEELHLDKFLRVHLGGKALNITEMGQIIVSGDVSFTKGKIVSSSSKDCPVVLKSNSSLKFDMIEYSSNTNGVLIDSFANNAKFNLENGSKILFGGNFGISTNASDKDDEGNFGKHSTGITITVKSSTISDDYGRPSYAYENEKRCPSDIDSTGILFNVEGSVLINSSKISANRQAVILRGGTHTISGNSSLSSIGYTGDDESNWKDGNRVPVATLVVGNGKDNGAYKYKTSLNITSRKVTITAPSVEEYKAVYVCQVNEDYPVIVTWPGCKLEDSVISCENGAVFNK